MGEPPGALGLGLAWWPDTVAVALSRPDLGFVEVIAETRRSDPVPASLRAAVRRGLRVVVHGVSLSLGSVEPPSKERLRHLARLADALGAPLVSEHAAFVRAGGVDVGHLTPLPRTRDALAVLVDNVRLAQAELPVPLAIENPAALFEWPDAELDEAAFLTELVERTGCLLLLDLANAYVNGVNHGTDPISLLDRLPLERVAYVHVAGGIEREGLLHDTHAHPLWPRVEELVEEAASRATLPGVLLEREGVFPPADVTNAELDRIALAWSRGLARRSPRLPRPPARDTAAPVVPEAGRAGLREQQQLLARALIGDADAPARFDAQRVRAAGAALRRKRARERSRRASLAREAPSTGAPIDRPAEGASPWCST